MNFTQEVEQAEQRIHRMDTIDGGESHLPLFVQLTTVLLALKAGLQQPGSNSAYDAYVMLLHIINELRTQQEHQPISSEILKD